MKIVAITQARTTSTRLPNKVLLKADQKTLLEIHIERVLRSKKINQVVVATTTNSTDDKVAEIAQKLNVQLYRGSEQDVLDRYYQAAAAHKAGIIVRLTSDCPLIDSTVIDEIIITFLENSFDYVSNTINPTFPDGLDVEVFSFSVLESAWTNAKISSEREHVTPYIWKNSDLKGKTIFKAFNYPHKENLSSFRLTVDEQKDYELICYLVKKLGHDKPWTDYVDLIKNENLKINSNFIRNSGYSQSLKKDNNELQ